MTDADLQPVLSFYDLGRREGGFEHGVQMGIERILASPQFMFRLERDPAGAAPGSVYRISDLELASRLSFFLWSSVPDDELLTVAAAGKLKDRATLERQTRRMLADPKASALVSNFAGQWLQLRNVRSVQPNSDEFPDFDDNLRQAFKRETELFFESIMREDRNVLDLLRADYTFVNERLALHYGIPNVRGSRFRRVTVTDEARKGLLGQGSILARHVARRADVAGRARQVGAREHSGHAAGAAASRRAGAEGAGRGTEAAHDARTDGGASGESGLRQLSQGDGSDRLRARELRRGRGVAYARAGRTD